MYKILFKSIIDFFIALISFVGLLPLLIVIYILVRIKLGSPVFYKQERPGKNCKPFFMYKFRSMTNETDVNGVLLPNDKRLTSFGKRLRSSSLDELPSLFNVLKGDMSIVGPRPLRLRYLPFFSEEQNKRHLLKPGITGYAQVNGRSNLDWDNKLKLDIYYIKNVSFWLDAKIILKTFENVIVKKDTVPEGANFEIPFDEYIKRQSNA